jgi:hypothetical protein
MPGWAREAREGGYLYLTPEVNHKLEEENTMEASSIRDVAYFIAVTAIVVVPRAIVAYLDAR